MMNPNTQCYHVDAEFCERCWPPKEERPVLTLGEASKMNYEQLQKACEEFNKNGMSGEDIQKAWDKRWKDGFDTAMHLVYEALNGGDFTLAYTMADVIEMIEQEEELYRKDS